MTDAPKTRMRNSHEIEHALFDARNSCEKYLAANRYDTCTSFSYEFLVRVSGTCVTDLRQEKKRGNVVIDFNK